MDVEPVAPRWRDDMTVFAASRRRARRFRARVAAGVLGSALLGALAVALLLWLNPLETPTLVAPDLGPLPWGAAGRAALADGGRFRKADCGDAPGRPALEAALTRAEALRPHEPAVVYLHAFARPAAGVPLAVARGDVPLGEVLRRLAAAPPRRKLLVLDLEPLADDSSGDAGEGVAGRVPAELEAVPDAGRLTVVSCSPGERPQRGDEFGRPALARWLADGIAGRADGQLGSADGRVSAAELAAFARARVARWSRAARPGRQTPYVHGGADFPLAVAESAPPAALPERDPYPAWLTDAWAARDKARADGTARETPWLARRAEDELLAAEAAYRGGADGGELKAGTEARLSQLAGRAPGFLAVPGPPPASAFLEAALLRQEPDAALAAELAAMLDRIAPASGDGSAAAPETAAALAKLRERPPWQVGAAALPAALAGGGPTPDRLRALRSLLGPLAGRYYEALFADRLAALADRLAPRRPEAPADWPVARIRQSLRVALAAERLAARPDLIEQIGPAQEVAEQARHDAEVTLFAPEWVAASEADARLERAADLLGRVGASAAQITASAAVLDDALAELPPLAANAAATEDAAAAWREAASRAAALAARLRPPPPPGIDPVTELRDRALAARRAADALTDALRDVLRPYSAESVAALRERLKRADAPPSALAEADALLAVPAVRAADRAALARDRAAAARRLTLAALEAAAADDAAGRATPPPDPPADRPPNDGRRRAELAAAARAMAGDPESLDDPARNPTSLRRAQRARQLWAWRGSRAAYEALDPADPAGPWADFFARSAAELAPFAAPPAAPALTFPPAAPVPPLTPSAPARDYPLPLRLAAGGPTNAAVGILPPVAWLEAVQPEPVRVTSLADATFPLRVEARPDSPGDLPPGVLVEARVGGRSFHHRLPVPLGPLAGRVELLASAEGGAPLPLGTLRLRPGRRTEVTILVRNPSPRPRRVYARLVEGERDAAGGRSDVVGVPAGQTRPLRFAGAAGAGAADAAARLPAPAGPLSVVLVDADAPGEPVLERRDFPVRAASPSETAQLDRARFLPVSPGELPRLELTFRPGPRLAGAPCPVELSLPPDRVPGLRGAGDSRLRGELEPGGQPLELYAGGLELDPGEDEEGFAHVSVDGVERALVLAVTFARGGGATTPRVSAAPAVRVRVEPFARAAGGVPFGVEVDNPPPGAGLEVSFGRTDAGVFRAEQTRRYPTARDERLGFSTGGPNGSLLFETQSADWRGVFPAGGTAGGRLVRARLVNLVGEAVVADERGVTVDAAAPEGPRFVAAPVRVARGAPLTLRATAKAPASGLREAVMYYGRPTDGAVPPTAVQSAAKRDGEAWVATLPPPERLGPLEVAVQFVSGVGARASAGTGLSVVDASEVADKADGAEIRGQLIEGDRPQRALEVVLLDPSGAEKARVRTDDDGAFRFDRLPPGRYRLTAEKLSSRRVASAEVGVAAGERKSVALRLLLD